MLLAAFASPLIVGLFAALLVFFAKLTNLPKPSVLSLVIRSVLYALIGAGVSLAATIAWMIWYETSSGFSAGNAPLGWIFFYGPVSAALGQLLALAMWWSRKPATSQVPINAES